MISISTSYGPRLARHPQKRHIPNDPARLLQAAFNLDREADWQLSQGRPDDADRLSHLAFELRARAAGGRL